MIRRTPHDNILGLPRTVAILTAALVACVLVCLLTEWICRYFLHISSAIYTTPLRTELVPHPDLMGFYPRFAFLHTESFFTASGYAFMYPAAMVPLYQMFYAASPYTVAAYLTFSFAVLIVAALLFSRALMLYGIMPVVALVVATITMTCSYSVWFALFQSNMEIILWAVMALGTALYWRGQGYLAAVCFGMAASIKIYPALFLVLPLFQKRWGQAALGIAVAATYSIGAIFYVGPTFLQAYRGVAASLDLFRRHFMLAVLDSTGRDHSLFALFKLAFRNHLSTAGLQKALPLYLGLMSFGVLVLLATRVRRLPLVNQLAFCTVVCVLLPPTSFEYTLLHIWTVYALLLLVFLDASRHAVQVPGLILALTCCIVGLMFLPEVIFRGYQYNGMVKSFDLIVLLVTLLRYPFPAISHGPGRSSLLASSETAS